MDMVVTFRNIHGWMGNDSADAMFKAMYAALKPGGILGVVEHRAKTGKPQDPKAESGYVREDYAIALIEKAGFKLIGKSEVNANPKDTTDHPHGVWSLPPTLEGGDTDRDKYLAIGESDRFTLRFRKPE
jgi:predicted methyltransferase